MQLGKFCGLVARLGKPTMVLLIGLPVLAVASCHGQATEDQGTEDRPLFELESGTLDVQPGQYVLCPSRQYYLQGLKDGPSNTVIIYYSAILKEVGSEVSQVESLSGTEFSLPNQLIVPIPKGQKAKVGDIVLTWWQGGSGMQRAIVVGGKPLEPTVRYLDMDLGTTGTSAEDATLKADSFVVLSQDWQLGTSVAIKRDSQLRHGILVAISKEKILVSEFGSKLKLYDRSAARPVPMAPNLEQGDVVQGVVFGSFEPVTVTDVDSRIGRVFVSYEFGSSTKEAALGFGQIFKEE